MIIALVLGLLTGLPLGWYYFNEGIIFSTSMMGSYMAVRGLGLVFGGFPNEFILLNESKLGGFKVVEPIFYAYLGLIGMLVAISITFQVKTFKKMKEDEKYPHLL